jgi:hypothetical protein
MTPFAAKAMEFLNQRKAAIDAGKFDEAKELEEQLALLIRTQYQPQTVERQRVKE